MVSINIAYNVKEIISKTITDNDLEKIINKKLVNIILFMETYTNENNCLKFGSNNIE